MGPIHSKWVDVFGVLHPKSNRPAPDYTAFGLVYWPGRNLTYTEWCDRMDERAKIVNADLSSGLVSSRTMSITNTSAYESEIHDGHTADTIGSLDDGDGYAYADGDKTGTEDRHISSPCKSHLSKPIECDIENIPSDEVQADVYDGKRTTAVCHNLTAASTATNSTPKMHSIQSDSICQKKTTTLAQVHVIAGQRCVPSMATFDDDSITDSDDETDSISRAVACVQDQCKHSTTSRQCNEWNKSENFRVSNHVKSDNCTNAKSATTRRQCRTNSIRVGDEAQLDEIRAADSQASVSDVGTDPIEVDKLSDVDLMDTYWMRRRYPFENLVLSGGGVKGYAYVGAIKALHDAGILKQLKRFAGSSAGAMCSASLAIGYSPQEIAELFFVDLKECFQDQTCACLCCVPRLVRQYGVYPAKRFYVGFGFVIASKTGNKDYTFKQLYEDTGRELCIVVCNLTFLRVEYCHHTTTPDLAIREAVRMSMAVPFVYEPYKREVDGNRCYYIDGSAGDHFPIHAFDGPTIGANYKMPVNLKTIGCIVLTETDKQHVMWRNMFGKELPCAPTYLPNTKLAREQLNENIKKHQRMEKDFCKKKYLKKLETFSHPSLLDTGSRKHYKAANTDFVGMDNVLDFFLANLETLLSDQTIRKMKPADEQRVIPINVGYMEAHSYDFEPDDRKFLITQGYHSVQTFLCDYLRRQPTAN